MLVPVLTLLYNPVMKLAGILLVMSLLGGLSANALAQSQGRVSSGPVRASMAMLATLQDAEVLPPEGTPEANRIIQMVIQFQAVFMKSSDPSLRDFFDQALLAQWADQAQPLGVAFRSRGWTSQVLEALSAQYRKLTPQERARLGGAFSAFNMRLADFDILSELFRKAQTAYSQRGQDIHQIFAEHRRSMPGGKRRDGKEKQNGNQGLYSHQS
jgi:hypothetical protein